MYVRPWFNVKIFLLVRKQLTLFPRLHQLKVFPKQAVVQQARKKLPRNLPRATIPRARKELLLRNLP
jgi:hypothetical protein